MEPSSRSVSSQMVSRIWRRIAQAVLLSLAALPATAQHTIWSRQLGTSRFDSTHTASPDGNGGVFLGGVTAGNVADSHVGDWDAWIAHHRADGTRVWIQQFGTALPDSVNASAPDGIGGVYFGGSTRGSLIASQGGTDAWVARYAFDSSGTRIWMRQIGTGEWDSLSMAVTDGELGVYVGGSTEGALAGPSAGATDAWIVHFSPDGDELWSLQLGTPFTDRIAAGAPDGAGGLYVGGITGGALGGPSSGFGDAWLARIDDAGHVLWIRQFGTNREESLYTATPDAVGGVFVGGKTWGSLAGPSAGATDAWFARYDGAGNRLWIRQIGSSQHEAAYASAPAGAGGLFVAGSTFGPLFQPMVAEAEGWAALYDAAGNPVWTNQIGVRRYMELTAAAAGFGGRLYVGGQIDGSLGGPSAGDSDAWVRLLGPDAVAPPLVLDFETEDDFVTPLSNGQHIDTEFGRLVTLTSSGANAGLATFDSRRGGPNDPSQDPDLLIGAGNVLILQTENLPPDANDVFPRPNDDENGGTLSFAFHLPLEPTGLRLVDVDASDGTASVVETDAAGRRRTYAVPHEWTGDRTLEQPGQGWLDLSTLAFSVRVPIGGHGHRGGGVRSARGRATRRPPRRLGRARRAVHPRRRRAARRRRSAERVGREHVPPHHDRSAATGSRLGGRARLPRARRGCRHAVRAPRVPSWCDDAVR